jgi:hypothetical protein
MRPGSFTGVPGSRPQKARRLPWRAGASDASAGGAGFGWTEVNSATNCWRADG